MHKADRVWGGYGWVVKQVLRCRRVGLRAPVYVLVFTCGVILQGLFALLSLQGCSSRLHGPVCLSGLVRLLNVGFYACSATCCVFFVSAEVLLGLRRVAALV